MQQDPNASPFLEIPPIVLGLAVVIMGIELLFTGASQGLLAGAEGIGWRSNAVEGFGFSSPVARWMWTNEVYPAEHMLRFVSYPFVHYGFVHALMACVFILAIGKAVAQVFTPWKFMVIFFGASQIGAAVYGMVQTTGFILVGAYPGAYGLIGAFTFLLWVRAKVSGEAPLRAFGLIGMLAGIQLLFGLLFGGDPTWVADLSGFAAGFALSFVLVPGGAARLRALLQRR